MWKPGSYQELDSRWQLVIGPRGNPALPTGRLSFELVVGASAVLGVGFAVLAITEGRPLGFVLSLVGFAGVLWFVNLLRSGVYVSREGVRVVNPVRTYRFPWSGTQFAFRSDSGSPGQLVISGSGRTQAWVRGYWRKQPNRIERESRTCRPHRPGVRCPDRPPDRSRCRGGRKHGSLRGRSRAASQADPSARGCSDRPI